MYSFLKHKKLSALLILLVIGLAIYGNTFNNEFFWDDDDSVVNNVYIKDWQYFDKYFTENLIAGSGQVTNYYRPVLLISFALDYHFWKLNPFGFHLTNTFFHIFAAWLVFLILNKLIFKLKKQKEPIFFCLPFLVSLFFLIHPLQTEAVAYVAGRADSLSSLFSLLAIFCYIEIRENNKGKQVKQIRNRNFLRYLLILLFFILGLLTKEQVILLPVLILLIEAAFFIKKFNKNNILKATKLLLPLFLISGIYFLIRINLLNFNDILGGFNYNESYNSNIFNRLMTFAWVVVLYFKLLFIPTGLHMSREISGVGNLEIAVSLILFLVIVFVSIKTWKKNRLIGFGFLWFFIILLPRTNILPINRPMYEHWLYLPMIGFWLASFSSLALVFQKIKKKQNKLALPLVYAGCTALVACIFSFSALTVLRNNDWQNAIIFYEKNLRYTPGSFIQHNNLGMAYADAGRFKESIKEYKQAISIKDAYAQVHYNLANSLNELGQTKEAIKEYDISIKMSPSFQYPYNNLLNIYIKGNNKEKVEEILRKMLVRFGETDNFFYMAGVAYYNLSDFEKALANWKKLSERHPSDRNIRELMKNAKNMIR